MQKFYILRLNLMRLLIVIIGLNVEKYKSFKKRNMVDFFGI